MFDVVTIGSATRDAFFESDFPLISWPKAESGKAYVLPFGEKLDVKKVFFTIGGNAVNASVTFARQGCKTACVAKTGTDVSGEEIRRRLKSEGAETKFLLAGKELPTSYSVLLLEKGPSTFLDKTRNRSLGTGRSTSLTTGERTILNYRGVADSFSIRDVNLKQIPARWWYVSLAGESHAMLPRLLKFAAANHIVVAFNPSGHHIKHRRREILSALGNVSFLVLNTEEASRLIGISFRNEQRVFRELDALMPGRRGRISSRRGILAVTDGRKGATVSDGHHIYKAGVFPERKLVDRTGAGDAFGSGFVAGLLRRGIDSKRISSVESEDICYAIRLATANATSVVETIGATEGVLTRKRFADRRWSHFKIAAKKI